MSEQDFVIEEVGDLDAVWPELRALVEGFVEYNAAFLDGAMTPGWQEAWRASLETPDERLTLIGRIAGEAAGFMTTHVSKHPLRELNIGFIDDAFVLSEHRRGGLGAAMYDRTDAWCREQGANEVRLNAIVANAIAVDFWGKQGFKPLMYLMHKPLVEVERPRPFDKLRAGSDPVPPRERGQLSADEALAT